MHCCAMLAGRLHSHWLTGGHAFTATVLFPSIVQDLKYTNVTSVFLAGMFLFVGSDTFSVGCIV